MYLCDLVVIMFCNAVMLTVFTSSSLVSGHTSYTDIYALETTPGVLLRITMETTVNDFTKALESRNVQETAGHLVSVVIKDGGPKNAPLALLASHSLKALTDMCAGGHGVGSGENEAYREHVQFVLKCLACMPNRICHSVARQVRIV